MEPRMVGALELRATGVGGIGAEASVLVPVATLSEHRAASSAPYVAEAARPIREGYRIFTHLLSPTTASTATLLTTLPTAECSILMILLSKAARREGSPRTGGARNGVAIWQRPACRGGVARATGEVGLDAVVHGRSCTTTAGYRRSARKPPLHTNSPRAGRIGIDRGRPSGRTRACHGGNGIRHSRRDSECASISAGERNTRRSARELAAGAPPSSCRSAASRVVRVRGRARCRR